MGELETLLGDLGVQQWVKNKFIAKLVEFSGQTDVDKFVNEFNSDILNDFTKIARQTINETLEKATQIMEENKQ